MRKLILILALISFGITATAQDHWKGFFKPVTINPAVKDLGTRAGTSVWLFRPTVSISAIQLVWDKTTKEFNATSLNSAGFGIGYQHFIDVEGKPYNNFGFNALLLFDIVPTETAPTALSGALTVSAFQYLNVGAGYNFGLKTPFLLTGVTVKF